MAEPIVIIDSDDDCPPTNPKESQPSIEKDQMECPICLQTCIHPARLPCGHIFCFLCVKGVAYKNRRCAMCRREIPVEFLDHPQLVYSIQETGATTDGYQWFYEGRNGWWQYDERTCQDIEEAYKKGDKFCTILVAGYVYVVDFETMLQQRQNDPSRKRQVKRDLATTPKKGVAGLRIDGSVEPHSSHGTDASSSSSSTTILSQPMIRSNIISTIAATDAAIRIATDIIDSTLAHADEYRNDANSSSRSNSSSSSTDHTDLDGSSSGDLGGSRLDLLHQVEETLNISNASGLSTTAQNLDFFSSTIDEFRTLALSNLAQSSSDDSDDNDNDYDCIDSPKDTDQ